MRRPLLLFVLNFGATIIGAASRNISLSPYPIGLFLRLRIQDLLIYIAWQLGVATNQEIGEKFGLTYSAVSQRVSVRKELFNKDKELESN